MNLWLKRLGYTAVVLLWLIIMIFPTFAFFLATRGEIQVGNDPRSHIRFFMVQEETSSGVGVEWVRSARQVDNCTRTTLRYFLWDGGNQSDNVSFCQCYDPATDSPLPVEESRCTNE